MSQASLVQRLISFLKKPDALDYDRQAPVRNTYDDYESYQTREDPVDTAPVESYHAPPAYAAERPIASTPARSPNQASRLDALLMRAVKQFNAYHGFVIRYEPDGRMRYCTGRDLQGRYLGNTDVEPDRRAVFLALDSGESQLFVHTLEDNTPVAVLCGPLWDHDEVIGVLYLDNPARSRLHRGVFDVFCDQAARMLREGIA